MSLTVVKSEESDELVFVYDHFLEVHVSAVRLNGAEAITPSILGHHRLIFSGNKFGGATATVVPEQGSFVEGVLFVMSPLNLRKMGRFLGVNYLPKKAMFPTGEDSPEIEATYFAHRDGWDTVGLPNRIHLAGLINGYRDHLLNLEDLKDAVDRSCR